MGAITIHNFEHELPLQQEASTTYKLKSMLSQFSAASAIFVLNISYPAFNDAIQNSEDFRSKLIVYIATIHCTGLLVGGLVAQIIGGRAILISGGTALATGWIIYGWFSSVAIVQWIVGIVIFVMGMIQGPAYVYLAEISQPNLRNTLLAIVYLSTVVGSYYRLYLLTMKSIATVFPLLGLVMMVFLPDSPYWLANKGRYHRVESSLAWFRGWTTSVNVNVESKAIIRNAQDGPTACKLFSQKSLYIAALIVCYTFIVQAFMNNFHVMSFHDQTRLTEMSDNITASLSTDIRLEALIWIVFLVIVTIIGKKIMILIALLGASTALLAATVYGHSHEEKITQDYIYGYLFGVFLTATHFFINVAVMPIPALLNGELFPSRLRNVGAGFGLFFGNFFMYISLRNFSHFFVNYLGIDDLFLVLVCVGMFGFISLLWLFPRNENKSLVEIERSFDSMSNLRRKKQTFRLTR